MTKTNRDDPSELLLLAHLRINERIAELQRTRAQLAELIDQPSARPDKESVITQKRRKLSAETRAKLSAAANARWAKERGAKAKVQLPKPTAKKAKLKVKPRSNRQATARAKKSSAKKD